MSKKLIGVFRLVNKPYGKYKKIILEKTDTKASETAIDMSNVLALGEKEFEHLELIQPDLKDNDKASKGVKRRFKFIADLLQPVFYIYEESFGLRSPFVEAKYCKSVKSHEWETYPVYTQHVVNLVH